MSKYDNFGIPLFEMALDRSGFQNKIQEKFVGAVYEYAFIVVAKANGKTKWVQHKESEVRNLLHQLNSVFFDYSIKGKWDKRKAAIEALEFYRPHGERLISSGFNAFRNYYAEQPKRKPNPEIMIRFLDDVIDNLPKK